MASGGGGPGWGKSLFSRVSSGLSRAKQAASTGWDQVKKATDSARQKVVSTSNSDGKDLEPPADHGLRSEHTPILTDVPVGEEDTATPTPDVPAGEEDTETVPKGTSQEEMKIFEVEPVILSEAIEQNDPQAVTVVKALKDHELNEWNIKLSIWKRNQMIRFLSKQEVASDTAKSSEIQQLLEKVSFLEDCWATYTANHASDNKENAPEEISASTSPMPDVPFEERFRVVMPKDFIIYNEQQGNEIEETSSSNKALPSSSDPYFKFREAFHQMLEENYGHLSERVLFGDPEQSEQNMILFEAFKDLDSCSNLGKYFEKKFPSTPSAKLLDQYTSNGFSSPRELHRMILDEIMMYCFYLIESRIQTMQVFEEFERELHHKITSYEFLTDVALSGLDENRLSQLQDHFRLLGFGESQTQKDREDKQSRQKEVYEETLTPHKRSVYQCQLKLFEQVLSVLESLELKSANEVKECLNSGKNHYSYLHKHLHRLQAILSTLLKPYRVSWESAHKNNICTIQMSAGTITDALSTLKSELIKPERCLKEGDEVRLCADTVLYGDGDINSDEFQGVNIVLIAPKIVCKKDGKLCIKTDGKTLDDLREVDADPANHGTWGTEDDKDGTKGSDGDDGRYGNAGGHILLVANDLNQDDFDLSANGSVGECGQDGGYGGSGYTPTRKGEDGREPEFERKRGKFSDAVIISYGTFGEDGGKGGDAGMGGAAGRSGINGKIELLDLKGTCEELDSSQVDDGDPGSPGEPGEAGQHTRHGIDKGAHAKSAGFGGILGNIFFRMDKRDKDYFSGWLTHPEINPGRPGSGEHIERPARGKGPPRQFMHIGPRNPMFTDKRKNIPGKLATFKVNTALAKENRAINKQALLRSMRKQFELSLQHWNVQSHNQFLSAFAQRIGEAYQENTFIALTHSEVLKANSAAWLLSIQQLGKAAKSTTVQTQRVTKTQVQVMKDFAEESRNTGVSYLDSKSYDQKSLSLDLSPLKEAATVDDLRKHLENIKLESLLFSSEFDELVELLPSQLKLSTDNIVIVACNDPSKAKVHKLNHKFLIVKDAKGNFLYVHWNNDELNIKESAILDRLNSVSLQQNEPTAIKWDNVLYPQIIEMIRSNLGHDVIVPFTLSQLLCFQKLEVVVAMRKTYHAIGGKYIHSFEKSQAFRKLYSQYLDELMLCNSPEALSTLKQNLLEDSLLLLPLDLSWIINPSSVKDDSKDLHTSLVAYNHHPTFSRMLCILRLFHDYHQACISQPQKRLAYLSHLSSDVVSSGLNELHDQLCIALRIFCDENHIDCELPCVTSVARSEILFVHLVPSLTECKQNCKDFQQTISSICEQQPPMFTVVDKFLNKFVEFSESLLETEFPKRKALVHTTNGFSFNERFAVFEALPSIRTALAAFSAYPEHHTEQQTLFTHNQKPVKKLLEYVYDVVRSCLSTFHPQTTLCEFVQALDNVGLNTELQDTLEKLVSIANEQDSRSLVSLIHLLNRVHCLTAWEPTKNDDVSTDQKKTWEPTKNDDVSADQKKTWEPTQSDDVSLSDETKVDLAKLLLTQVPEYFEQLKQFLENLSLFRSINFRNDNDEKINDFDWDFETSAETNSEQDVIPVAPELRYSAMEQTITFYIKNIIAVCNTLYQYPMAVSSTPLRDHSTEESSSTLQLWESYLKSTLELIPSTEEEFMDCDINSTLKEKLNTLRRVLEKSISDLKSLASMCCELKVIEYISTLDRYVEFHQVKSDPDRRRGKLLILYNLALEKRFYSTPCVDALSKQLYPSLIAQGRPYHVTVVTERLNPSYDVCIQSLGPNEDTIVDSPTVFLFPNKDDPGKWKICAIDHSPKDPNSYTFHYTDLSDDLINSILDERTQQSICESVFSLQLSEEQKAAILSRLDYEQDERTIRHRVSLHEQVLLDEINTPFSLMAMNSKTGVVTIHEDPTNLKQLDGSHLLIIQCQLNIETRSALQTLKISEHQLASFEENTAVCIVKHPGHPAMIQAVYKCGDKVEHDFSYFMPLVIDHLSFNGNKSVLEQLQPLTDLLNRYHHFYQSLLPIDRLSAALEVVLKQCVFGRELVWKLQRSFIQHCLGTTSHLLESSEKALIRRSINNMLRPNAERSIQYHMYLTGLESYIYYFLAGNKVRWQLKRTETDNIHYQLWKSALNEIVIDEERFKCLCLTFAFLRDPQRINFYLQNVTSAVRFEIYQSISNGLKLLLSCQITVHRARDQEDPIAIIKQYHEMISTYQEHHTLEAVYEASLEMEDERNLESLLEMVLSTPPLKDHLLHYLRDKHLSDKESCQRLLKQWEFMEDIYEKVLNWCIQRQMELINQLQHIASDPVFDSPEKEEFISTASSWLLERTEVALSGYNWKELELVFMIIEMLAISMTSEISEVQKKGSNHGVAAAVPFNLLSNSLTIVQVFDASLDVSSIATVMASVPRDQWLKYLLIQNLLLVCAEQFGADSTNDLQEQLLSTDTKLIQILYNVFIEDQYNHDDTETESSSVGKISALQLKGILDWLPYIEPVPDACSALCKTPLSVWEKELAEIHFKQYFDQWHGLTDGDRKRTTYLLNRVRLNERARVSHSEFMSILSMIKDQYLISSIEDSDPLLALVEHLYYKRVSLDQAKIVVTSHKYEQWCEQFNSLITEEHALSDEPQSMVDVLELIRKQVQSGSYAMSMDEFELLQNEALEISKQVKELAAKDPMTEEEIQEFLKGLSRHTAIAEKQQWIANHRKKFILHLIYAWILVTSTAGKKQIPYNTQVISLLLFLHNEECGLLQQMKTGEGKSTVVGLLAAAKALAGFNVDIVTSNRDLAERGVRDCQAFFNVIGLQGAANCTDDESTNRQAYKSHIVYGDVGSFQRDVLSEEMGAGHANFIARYSDQRKYCLLVDEVDSMFLDKGRHMLYISHESPALKHLESLFMMIWSAVVHLSSNLNNENENVPIDDKLNQIATDLNTAIQKSRISVPEYLTGFCRRKMKSWVYSAYQAYFMEADDQFIIDRKATDKDEHAESAKHIFPMDKHTGIEEYNMKWTNGLSQFLELKYRRALSSESLKAVFISNLRFFKRYGKALYGLTGTLGSFSSRRLLQEIYNISTVNIPTNRPKRYTRQKSRVACNDQQWCEEIHKEICDRNPEQPILVICENIKRLKELQKHLEENGRTDVIHYARDKDKSIENSLASRGQLILATNKGGRGTDIKIREEDRHKGLHVIVSFLPENSRIEEQAFGRAARAGQPGSGCLVLQIDRNEYKEEIEIFGTETAATETLVEIEKIRRDQSESDRIGLLLNEGVPQLNLEESLYQSFRDYRREFEASLEGVELLGVEVCEELKKACVVVMTDQWAYWLDSVSESIRAADCAKKRQAITDDFNEDFLAPRLNPSKSYPDPTIFLLFSTPEYCISIGQALIKQKKFEAAQKCFDLAIDRGDKTGLAAMSACYCFCKIKSNSKPKPKNKKVCRRYLKTAQSKLDALRQSWVSNGKILEALHDGLRPDVDQYVDSEENHYTHQISEKLKVIGLHLNTLETLLGGEIDESSFIKESELDTERITAEDSRKVYHKLVSFRGDCNKSCGVDCGMICHFKVRSCWKKKEKLEPLIRKEVEPRIADGLIACISENTSVTEEHMTCFVYSSDELWQILAPLMENTEEVVMLEVSQVEDKLPDENLIQLWKKLQETFSDQLTSSNTTHGQLAVSFEDELCKKLKAKDSEYEPLTKHLEKNALYRESCRGMLRHDASDLLKELDLKKYEECKISEQTMREYLFQLFPFCKEHKQGYFFEYMLEFDRQDKEAKKLHGFLLKHEMLKSGVLVWHEHYEDDSKLESAVKKALQDENYSKKQIKFIVSVVQRLRGDVRGFQRRMEVGFVDFYELKDHPEDIPQEIDFFSSWHLDYFLTLEQADKGWWDWNAFAVAMMGLGQVILGVVLVTVTAGIGAQIGTALIAEGINDMVYATIAGITGTFSWKDWAIQKAISVAISIVTGGIGALAGPAKVAAQVGSAARYSTFAKTLAKAAGEFVVNATAAIVTDVLLADIQERVVAAIVNKIEEKVFDQIAKKLRAQLVIVATHKANENEFHAHCQEKIKELRSALGLHEDDESTVKSQIASAFEQVGFSVISSLTQNYKTLADKMLKSQSKWAKLVGAGAKAASMAHLVYTAVNAGLDAVLVGKAMYNLTENVLQTTGEAVHSESDVNDAIVQREFDEIKQCFHQFAQKQLQQKLKGVLQTTIKGSMKGVARAGQKTATKHFKKTFQNKTSSQVVKDAHKLTLVSDYDDESSSKKRKPQKPRTEAEKKDQEFQERREKLKETVMKPQRKNLSDKSGGGSTSTKQATVSSLTSKKQPGTGPQSGSSGKQDAHSSSTSKKQPRAGTSSQSSSSRKQDAHSSSKKQPGTSSQSSSSGKQDAHSSSTSKKQPGTSSQNGSSGKQDAHSSSTSKKQPGTSSQSESSSSGKQDAHSSSKKQPGTSSQNNSSGKQDAHSSSTSKKQHGTSSQSTSSGKQDAHSSSTSKKQPGTSPHSNSSGKQDAHSSSKKQPGTSSQSSSSRKQDAHSSSTSKKQPGTSSQSESSSSGKQDAHSSSTNTSKKQPGTSSQNNSSGKQDAHSSSTSKKQPGTSPHSNSSGKQDAHSSSKKQPGTSSQSSSSGKQDAHSSSKKQPGTSSQSSSCGKQDAHSSSTSKKQPGTSSQSSSSGKQDAHSSSTSKKQPGTSSQSSSSGKQDAHSSSTSKKQPGTSSQSSSSGKQDAHSSSKKQPGTSPHSSSSGKQDAHSSSKKQPGTSSQSSSSGTQDAHSSSTSKKQHGTSSQSTSSGKQDAHSSSTSKKQPGTSSQSSSSGKQDAHSSSKKQPGTSSQNSSSRKQDAHSSSKKQPGTSSQSSSSGKQDDHSCSSTSKKQPGSISNGKEKVMDRKKDDLQRGDKTSEKERSGTGPHASQTRDSHEKKHGESAQNPSVRDPSTVEHGHSSSGSSKENGSGSHSSADAKTGEQYTDTKKLKPETISANKKFLAKYGSLTDEQGHQENGSGSHSSADANAGEQYNKKKLKPETISDNKKFLAEHSSLTYEHGHHPDNAATGLQSHRGSSLLKHDEIQRSRIYSEVTNSEKTRGRQRANTNAIQRGKNQRQAPANKARTSISKPNSNSERKIYVHAEVDENGNGTGLYKIGLTKQDTETRRRQYQTGNARRLVTIREEVVNTQTDIGLKRVETAVHNVLQRVNTRHENGLNWTHAGGKEWFVILDRDYRDAMRHMDDAIRRPRTVETGAFRPRAQRFHYSWELWRDRFWDSRNPWEK